MSSYGTGPVVGHGGERVDRRPYGLFVLSPILESKIHLQCHEVGEFPFFDFILGRNWLLNFNFALSGPNKAFVISMPD